jgi:hypothetical protein
MSDRLTEDTMAITSADITTVWEAWVSTRPRPKLCRLTAERKKLIRARLKLGYEPGDLVAVIRYMNESNDGQARWMRGENPRNRTYLDLENLFRVHKLGERVEAALAWLEDGGDNGPPPAPTGVELGPLGQFGRGAAEA